MYIHFLNIRDSVLVGNDNVIKLIYKHKVKYIKKDERITIDK